MSSDVSVLETEVEYRAVV